MSLVIDTRTNGSNTFIRLGGVLCADKIGEVAAVISRYRHQNGKFFVSTESATHCEAEARQNLHQALLRCPVLPSSIYFKGKFAFDLAPNGCRVLVMNKTTKKEPQGQEKAHQHKHHPDCTGNCATCPRCRGKKH